MSSLLPVQKHVFHTSSQFNIYTVPLIQTGNSPSLPKTSNGACGLSGVPCSKPHFPKLTLRCPQAGVGFQPRSHLRGLVDAFCLTAAFNLSEELWGGTFILTQWQCVHTLQACFSTIWLVGTWHEHFLWPPSLLCIKSSVDRIRMHQAFRLSRIISQQLIQTSNHMQTNDIRLRHCNTFLTWGWLDCPPNRFLWLDL